MHIKHAQQRLAMACGVCAGRSLCHSDCARVQHVRHTLAGITLHSSCRRIHAAGASDSAAAPHVTSTARCSKDALLRNVRQMRAMHGGGGDAYAFHPEGYILPQEYTRFVAAWMEHEVRSMRSLPL
jgi:anthranilate/para-aminobenzoate synthase component II